MIYQISYDWDYLLKMPWWRWILLIDIGDALIYMLSSEAVIKTVS